MNIHHTESLAVLGWLCVGWKRYVDARSWRGTCHREYDYHDRRPGLIARNAPAPQPYHPLVSLVYLLFLLAYLPVPPVPRVWPDPAGETLPYPRQVCRCPACWRPCCSAPAERLVARVWHHPADPERRVVPVCKAES